MPNLEPSDTKTKLKALLGLNTAEANAKLDVCFEMAVQQVIREFGSSIGKKTAHNIPVQYKPEVSGESEEMCFIILPDDLRKVNSLFLGTNEVGLLDPEDFMKTKKFSPVIGSAFIGCLQVMEDGTKIVDLFPSSISLNGTFIDLVYTISGKDLSIFPEMYSRYIFYTAAKEYLLFDTVKRDPAIHSKIKAEWREARNEITEDTLYLNGNSITRKTDDEIRFDQSFNTY